MITYDCFNYGKRCSQLVLMIICSLLFCETFSQTSWNWLKPLPTGNHIESVYFINQKIGYAAGILGTIIHTTDSGANWTLQNSNSSNNLYQIYFINKNYGFAVGKSGIILRTVNGGNYWERINSSNRCDLHDIIFVNKNILN